MKLYIKNMLCPRCIAAVEQLLKSVNAAYVYVHLGEVLLKDPLSLKQLEQLNIQLQKLGFELLDDNRK